MRGRPVRRRSAGQGSAQHRYESRPLANGRTPSTGPARREMLHTARGRRSCHATPFRRTPRWLGQRGRDRPRRVISAVSCTSNTLALPATRTRATRVVMGADTPPPANSSDRSRSPWRRRRTQITGACPAAPSTSSRGPCPPSLLRRGARPLRQPVVWAERAGAPLRSCRRARDMRAHPSPAGVESRSPPSRWSPRPGPEELVDSGWSSPPSWWSLRPRVRQATGRGSVRSRGARGGLELRFQPFHRVSTDPRGFEDRLAMPTQGGRRWWSPTGGGQHGRVTPWRWTRRSCDNRLWSSMLIIEY